MALNNKINWAVIGLGAQGETLIKAINSSKNSSLKAVYSESGARTAEIAKQTGARQFVSIDNLLQEKTIDAVAIATPNYLHAEESISALKAGKHVFCEKPMALSLKEARAVKRAAEKSDSLFGLGFHLRFQPVFLAAKKIMESGRLGKIRLAQMHWSVGRAGETEFSPLPSHKRWREEIKLSGGGALMARGVHLFDLAVFLLGREAGEVFSLSDAKEKKQIDQTILSVARIGETLVEFATSRLVPFANNHITIYGSHGRLFMPEPFTYDGTGILQITTERGSVNKKFSRKINLYQKEIEAFSAAALTGRTWPGAGASDGVINAAMVENKKFI